MARIQNDMVEGVRGKVGKKFVYKERNGKTFISKMPDMSNVVATKNQTKNRNIFAEAVEFARELKKDPARAKAFKLNEGELLYLAAIKEYMRMHGDKKTAADSNSKYYFKKLLEIGLSKRQANAALYIMTSGKLTNDDCQKMNNISKPTATRDLKVLTDKNIIEFNGVKGAGAAYKMGSWWSEWDHK